LVFNSVPVTQIHSECPLDSVCACCGVTQQEHIAPLLHTFIMAAPDSSWSISVIRTLLSPRYLQPSSQLSKVKS